MTLPLIGQFCPIICAEAQPVGFPQTLQFINRLVELPSEDQQDAYLALVGALVEAGVWSKLDVLMVPGIDAGGQSTNLVSVNNRPLLNETSLAPLFQGNIGWSTTGVNQDLLTVNLSTFGGNYSQDSAMIGCWNLAKGPSSNGALWLTNSNVSVELYPLFSGDIYTKANCLSEFTDANPGNSDGFYVTSRTSSGSYSVYKNGNLLGSHSATSVAPEDDTLNIGLGAFEIACFVLGGGLTDQEVSDMYDAIRGYINAVLPGLSTVGWNPYDQKFAGLTFSNSNRKITANSHIAIDGLDNMVRTNAQNRSGKYYAEMTITIPASGNTAVLAWGLAGPELTITGASSGNHICYVINSGSVVKFFGPDFPGGTTVAPANWVTGDVIAMAVDFDAALIWFKNLTQASNWNNTGGADPATGTSGKTIATFLDNNTGPVFIVGDIIGGLANVIVGQALTLSVGLPSFTGTIPTGFSNWGEDSV